MPTLPKARLLNRMWLVSVAYLLLLTLALNSVFAEVHFPGWAELLIKATVLPTFVATLAWPLWCWLMRFRGARLPATLLSRAIIFSAYATAAGYILLFAELMYVKLMTCDAGVPAGDPRWHCQVESTGIVFEFILIPMLAAVLGLAASVILDSKRRP